MHNICVAGTDPGFFLGGGALISCCTSTPINHIVFFWQNTSCIRKPQVISGGGVHTPCTLPLDPPLRCRGSKPLSIIIGKLHVTFLCKLFLRIWCYIKTLSFHDHIANFLNFHYCLLENVSKCIVTKSILLTPITPSI